MNAIAHPLLGKTTRTLAVMCAALAVPYATPRLEALRVTPAPWDTHAAGEHADEGSEGPPPAGAASAPPPATERAGAACVGEHAHHPQRPALRLGGDAAGDGPGRREDAADDRHRGPVGPRARSLLRAPGAHRAQGGESAVTRILHYGDSTIASDYVSGTMRRRLQARYGDAGHGFILIANPWEWYFHNDVFHASSGDWKASRLAGPIAVDGLYGLGGVSFTSYGGGAATFGTAAQGHYGKKVSRYDDLLPPSNLEAATSR